MSASVIQAPSIDDVVDLMHGLFDLGVKAAANSTESLFSIAEYTNEAGDVVGYIGCDLAGGCRLGAALTQVPAGRVDEAVSEGCIPENLIENLEEVFNISVNLIVPDDGSRVVFKRAVHGTSDADFAALNAKIESMDASEFCFDITRYGVCRVVVAN